MCDTGPTAQGGSVIKAIERFLPFAYLAALVSFVLHPCGGE